MNTKIVFDTDIGSDVDDALALAFLLKTILKRLVAVTTVYGPTNIRAKAALTLISQIGVKNPDVIAGTENTITPNMPIWTTGKESYLVKTNQQPSTKTVASLMDELDDFVLLATGPLTNVAHMLQVPYFTNKCKLLVIIGGCINPTGNMPEIEHNFGADPKATQMVFGSPIPKVLVPLDVTLKYKMQSVARNLFRSSNIKSVKLLNLWISKWVGVNRTFPKTIPFYNSVYYHDPIAAAYFVYPKLFSFENLFLGINDSGKVTFDGKYPVRVCTKINKSLISKILNDITK